MAALDIRPEGARVGTRAFAQRGCGPRCPHSRPEVPLPQPRVFSSTRHVPQFHSHPQLGCLVQRMARTTARSLPGRRSRCSSLSVAALGRVLVWRQGAGMETLVLNFREGHCSHPQPSPAERSGVCQASVAHEPLKAQRQARPQCARGQDARPHVRRQGLHPRPEPQPGPGPPCGASKQASESRAGARLGRASGLVWQGSQAESEARERSSPGRPEHGVRWGRKRGSGGQAGPGGEACTCGVCAPGGWEAQTLVTLPLESALDDLDLNEFGVAALEKTFDNSTVPHPGSITIGTGLWAGRAVWEGARGSAWPAPRGLLPSLDLPSRPRAGGSLLQSSAPVNIPGSLGSSASFHSASPSPPVSLSSHFLQQPQAHLSQSESTFLGTSASHGSLGEHGCGSLKLGAGTWALESGWASVRGQGRAGGGEGRGSGVEEGQVTVPQLP